MEHNSIREEISVSRTQFLRFQKYGGEIRREIVGEVSLRYTVVSQNRSRQ